MFTGLVEEVGAVRERRDDGEGALLRIAASFTAELEQGESVAVDGVCLSVVGRGDGAFSVEASPVTLSRTTLGGYREGRRVNLERALRTGDRLGGHVVQGHVDAVGRVTGMEQAGETVLLRVRLPPGVARTTVPRGSLAVDGVSLTVSELADEVAEFAVVPYTWRHTALDRLAPGREVNLEADLMGKYVERLLAPYLRELPGETRPGGGAGG